jgi:ABC-type nitrate/sulfonate/bicarbonate transport system ATPase subunit
MSDERRENLVRARSQAEAPALELRGVARAFTIAGTRVTALQGVDLVVRQGELVAILGPNGSGKSTLLRIMAGLLAADEGSVSAHGTAVLGPTDRVGLVFQEPRLLPWRDTLANVAFPLELAGVHRDERERQARAALELVGLDAFEGAYPAQLSGGMAQKAALARALVRRPSVLLLDEPFSALDALTRERLDLELQALWQREGMTLVVVTHSIPEAVMLADRIVVLSASPGRLIADIRVEVPRPRSLADVDRGAFAVAMAEVRDALELGASRPTERVAA